MVVFRAGRYAARMAISEAEVRRCQALRHLAFIEARGLGRQAGGLDSDAFDAQCRHVMVEEAASGALVCCFRILPLADGAEIARSYSAGCYDLGRLARYPGPMFEIGRFCIHPAWHDPNIVRTAWAGLMRLIDADGVGLVFGCSSFEGVDPAPYADAMALLAVRHLAPERWRPGVRAARVFPFAERLRAHRPDLRRGLRLVPPLLRSYLLMGGWVSDHAVIDMELGTLHVFIGVEIARMPPARARMLRRGGTAADPALAPAVPEPA